MEKQSTRKFLKLIVALVALFLLGASALMLASCNKDEHQHSYTSSVTTPATCSNPGVETFTCSCGLTYTQIIPATGDHDWEKVKEYPASCESEGWTVYECSVCHEQKQDDWVQKRDHKYEAVETVEATCTTDGYQIMQCSYCGDRYTDDQYSAEHKATGHKWIVNTDPADPASDEDKKLGFVTVKEADCLNAAQLERTCSVCGHSEPKESGKPLGHLVDNAVPTKNLCKIDESLVDAEGNAVYAFECERENCPVEVKIDKAGHTAHYVKAVDHKMKTIKEDAYCVDDKDAIVPAGTHGNGESYKYEYCENCDTYGGNTIGEDTLKTPIEAKGHKWNTVQLGDNGDPVVVCEADTVLSTWEGYSAAMKAAWGVQKYSQNLESLTTYYKTTLKDKKFSRYCSDCGALQVADGHDYVIAALEEGKYDTDDYEKDENGLPVVAEGVTVATMDCRYVQVCQNEGCGKVLERGKHGETTAATCRERGKCETCGEPLTEQLTHKWVNISSFVNAKGEFIKNDPTPGTGNAKPDGTFLTNNIKRQAAYDAWKKLSATETWMVPVAGNCEDETTSVHVCAQCLVDAVKDGAEVAWNTATEFPAGTDKPATTATNTNAYVISTGFGHDYQPTYFDLSGNEIVWEQTNCEIGFMIKYVCTRCEEVFTNVPVANDPNTMPEDAKEDSTDAETNEARVNKLAKLDIVKENGLEATVSIFTDADGFVINVPTTDKTYDEGDNSAAYYNSADFDAKALEAALASKQNNVANHKVTLAEDYQDLSTYVAPTCTDKAVLPLACKNCGANHMVYGYDVVKASETTANTTLYIEAVDGWDNELDAADKSVNVFNHAGKAYDCGTHCDVKNATQQFICGGYNTLLNEEEDTNDITDTEIQTMIKGMSHDTVTVSYDLATASNYYEDYTIMVATFYGATEGSAIDWDDAVMTENTKLSRCASKDGTMPNYVMPLVAEVDLTNDGYKHAADFRNATVVSYLVLVSADGKEIYTMTGTGAYSLYTESDSTTTSAVDADTKVEKNDTFFLKVGDDCKAPVHATDVASLKKALKVAEPDEKGVATITLAKDVTFATLTSADQPGLASAIRDLLAKDDVTSLVLDLNGSTVPVAAGPTVSSELKKPVTVKNGNLNYESKEANNDTTFLTIQAGTTVTFENVTINSGKLNAISVAYSKDATTNLTFVDSSITSYGEVGIIINAKNADAVAVSEMKTAVVLENTDVIMTNAPLDTTFDTLSAALVVGAPVAVEVTDGSTLSAAGQALVVRGGSVSVADSAIALTRYDAPENEIKDQAAYTTKFGNSLTDSNAVSSSWRKFNDGITDLQTYRLAGLWGEANAVPRAAVVIGNSDTRTDNYEFDADVEINRVTFTVDEDDFALVLGTVYSKAMVKDPTYADSDKKNPIYDSIITLDVTGSNLSEAAVMYTFNSMSNGEVVNANYVALKGFVK